MITKERFNAIDEEWKNHPERFRSGSVEYWGEVRQGLLDLLVELRVGKASHQEPPIEKPKTPDIKPKTPDTKSKVYSKKKY